MTDRHDIATIHTTCLTDLIVLLARIDEHAPMILAVEYGPDGVTVYRPADPDQLTIDEIDLTERVDIDERLAGHVPSFPA